jgi:ABC-type nitrate/sulfonate/bicarbonate transport system ATPase subunit
MVKQVNDVVSSVYTYPLFLLSPDVTDGELNYRFPVVSKDTTSPISEDAGELSSGQRAIMNFAFRLVALQRLGLNKFPLFLDEPNSKQDETHSKNMISYIKLITDSAAFGGLVMINHNIAECSALNGDVLVLEGSNISIPENANLNITVKK